MLIRKLSAIAAICGYCTVSSPAMAEDLSVKEMLLKQQQQIEALQSKIAEQEAVHNEALTHYIKNEVDRALADHSGSLLTLGSNVENLTFKGDLRVRWENVDWDDNSNDDANSKAGKQQDRFRQRFRLGFLWKTNEGWEIGAGLATGGSSAISANDTYSEGSAFETGNISLDYAYAKHKFDSGLSLTLGQHKNPFIHSGIMYDSDVRFVGATGQFSNDSGFFATAGAYEVFNYDKDAEDSAKLFAVQAGVSQSGLTAALGYFHYNSAITDEWTDLDADDAFDDNEWSNNDTDFQIVHAYAGFEGKTDSFGYNVYAEYFVNIGADNDGTSQAVGPKNTLDPEDEDTGFVLGADISVDKMKFGYQYANIEADAAYRELTDSDFASSISEQTNAEAHIFKASYKVTKNFSIGTKYVMAEEIDGTDEGELFQFDFKYKF